AAYTLKARLALHLAKVRNDAYTIALDAIANGFTGNDEDMQVPFGEKQNEWNPAYQYFMNDRPYDIVMGAFFVDTLRNDPRFNLYVDTTGAADDPSYGQGAHPGQADGFAYPGATFISPNSPVTLMSYAEAKFIEAEAALSSDKARAANAYNDAVNAAFSKYGLAAPTSLTSETASTISLAKIIMQKYIALFMNPETFTDYRRTGYPQLTPPSNALTVDKKLPRRWPYPTSERLYNAKNFEPYENITISNRVWWDKE
ncbi:MAG: SusD/RagB family nutrient-binding outer membrane lipoprotein, partial [Bacteroidales bacterium]